MQHDNLISQFFRFAEGSLTPFVWMSIDTPTRLTSILQSMIRLRELRSIGSLWVSFRPSVSFAYGVWPFLQPTRSAGDDNSLPPPPASVGRPFPAHTPKTDLLLLISYKSDEYVDLVEGTIQS
ncbi:hypothetical protein R3P38DRAFT_3242860 [Favolaschia claudopus]|uniref:Uncharacterized protein n=1 Tax=Favolaschia claudopus TaxID=2862362 RepID=A0AAV9Z4B3_9AGAR